MQKIAFITDSNDPELTTDDALAVAPLAELGITVVPCPWDMAEPDVEVLILRSCWNYHYKPQAFENWLRAMESQGRRILNTPDVIRWNLNKKYLLELADKGARIPETKWFPRGAILSPQDIRLCSNVESIVVKPAVSGNGKDTSVFKAQDETGLQQAINKILESGDVIIQAYLPEIKTQGEISLTFFNGEYSHTIRKTPANQDFRVQVIYGGTNQAMQSSQLMIDEARKMLELVGKPILYARVDVIEQNGLPVLIEIEVLEPHLYLEFDPMAPQRFAKAIQSVMKEG